MINKVYILVILFFAKPGNCANIDVSQIVRIVGGNIANISDFPFLISLRKNDIHHCGGSILSVNYVLTAAHCTNKLMERELTVKAGSTYLNTSNGQLVNVRKIYQHPQYHPKSYDYDIAVLRLNSSLVLGVGVRTINTIESGKQVPSGVLCLAPGWGETVTGGDLSNQLQVVALAYIPTTECTIYYKSAITKRMFCAGYEKGQKDTCTGDSGGPLVFNGVLVGVTSWGGKICAGADAPGVFTRVSSYRTYIDSIVAKG